MRLVIASCSVDYAGRLTAHLPSATRLLLVKADGSVLVHSDGGSYKPLNWMSPPCTLATDVDDDGAGTWTVTNKAGEKLVITIETVHHDSAHELGVDPGLVKDGVEALGLRRGGTRCRRGRGARRSPGRGTRCRGQPRGRALVA